MGGGGGDRSGVWESAGGWCSVCVGREGGKRTLEVAEVGFLVERGALQTEGVDDVVDGLRAVLEGFVGFFGRGIGANVYSQDGNPLLVFSSTAVRVTPHNPTPLHGRGRQVEQEVVGVSFDGEGVFLAARGLEGKVKRTNVVGTERDHAAVGLVNGAVDFLEVVRVREDFVAGDDVLLNRNESENVSPEFYIHC